MTRGAFYYFIKPPDYVKLKSIVEKAIEQRSLKREIAVLQTKLSDDRNRIHITGNTPQICKILDTVESIRDSSSSVLICGETGTGKELVARALHFNNEKSDKPFIAVNCAAIPRDLMESELFGFEKGAFTGAVARRIGKIEEASGGTLFFDEIGELEISLQVKLLRVLQENEIERLGSNKKIKVTFRLISSSNRNLKEMVEKGDFREDLYYRINVIQIHMPPLRDRIPDIPLLSAEFLRRFCSRENKILTVSDQVIKAFQNYRWPGNIRQLKNVIERAVVLAKRDVITLDELPDELKSVTTYHDIQTDKTLKALEAQAIINTLQNCRGNKSKAAKMLGISRKAFYKRLSDYNIDQ
jgi:DNA-binding NtrC family response regulator